MNSEFHIPVTDLLDRYKLEISRIETSVASMEYRVFKSAKLLDKLLRFLALLSCSDILARRSNLRRLHNQNPFCGLFTTASFSSNEYFFKWLGLRFEASTLKGSHWNKSLTQGLNDVLKSQSNSQNKDGRVIRNIVSHDYTMSPELSEDYFSILRKKVTTLLSLAERHLGGMQLSTDSVNAVDVNGRRITPLKLSHKDTPSHLFPAFVIILDGAEAAPSPYMLGKCEREIKFEAFVGPKEMDPVIVKKGQGGSYQRLERDLSLDLIPRMPDSIDLEIIDHASRLGNLTGGFMGRELALAELSRLILESSESPILVDGPPGVGKSALMARLYQILSEGDTIPAIHFFRDSDIIANDIERMGKSLCGQVWKSLRRNPRDLSDDPHTLLMKLQRDLRDSGVDKVNRVAFLIDGLDELPDDSRRRECLSLIERFNELGIRVVLSTRPNAKLGFGSSHISLRADDPQNLADLRLAVDTALSSQQLALENKEEAISAVCEFAQGIFYWATLKLRQLLSDEITVSEIQSYTEKGVVEQMENELRRFKLRVGDQCYKDIGLSVLALMTSYRLPVTPEHVAGILEIPETNILWTLKNCDFMQAETIDGKVTYLLEHILAEVIPQNDLVRTALPAAARHLLRFHSRDRGSVILMEQFDNWAKTANSYIELQPYLEDTEFVENWNLHRRSLSHSIISSLSHPIILAPPHRRDFDSDQEFICAYLRSAITQYGLSNLRYDKNDRNWITLYQSSSKTCSWLREHRFLPDYRNLNDCDYDVFLPNMRPRIKECMSVEGASEDPFISTEFYNLILALNNTYKRFGYTDWLVTSLGTLVATGVETIRKNPDSLGMIVPLCNGILFVIDSVLRKQIKIGSPHPVEMSQWICKLVDELVCVSNLTRVSLVLYISTLASVIAQCKHETRETIKDTIESRIDAIKSAVRDFFQDQTKTTFIVDNEFSFEESVFECFTDFLDEYPEIWDLSNFSYRIDDGSQTKLLEMWQDEFNAQTHQSVRTAMYDIARQSEGTAKLLCLAYSYKRMYYMDIWWDFDADLPTEKQGKCSRLIDFPWDIVQKFILWLGSVGVSTETQLSVSREIRNEWISNFTEFKFFKEYFGNQDEFWRCANDSIPIALEHEWPYGFCSRVHGFLRPDPPTVVKDAPESIPAVCLARLSKLQKAQDKAILNDDEQHEIDERHDRDQIILSVVSEYVLTPQHVFELASRFSRLIGLFSKLILPNIDPASDNAVAMFGHYFRGFTKRALAKNDIPERGWWSEYGDWTPFVDLVDDLSREEKYEIAQGWLFLIEHDEGRTMETLQDIKNASESQDCNECVFNALLDSFVQALYDPNVGGNPVPGSNERYAKVIGAYKELFPDLVYNSLFPDTPTFFNYFFELSDEQIIQWCDENGEKYICDTPEMGNALLRNPKRTADVIGRLDPSGSGSIDFDELIRELQSLT